MAFSKESPSLFSANSKEEILELTKKEYPSFWSEHLIVEGKEVLVVTSYIGSGVYWTAVSVYVKTSNMNSWRLLLDSDAHTSRITVTFDEMSREIVFFSRARKRLFSLPVESLDLGIDQDKQVPQSENMK